MDDLLAVVEHLCQPSESSDLRSQCPWTASETCRRFLPWLISEVAEVEEALDRLESATSGGEEEDAAAAHLTSELGDVLFDALMAVRLAQRDVPGVTLERAAQAAAAKIRGRTPYMPQWRQGDASAGTAAEAMRHWKAAKQREPEHRAPRRPTGNRRRRRQLLQTASLTCTGFAIVAAATLAIRAYKRA